MRHQRFSPVSVLEGLWVQVDLTNFSGPGPNPQVSYLCGAWWWGALSLLGSRAENLQGEKEVFHNRA